LVMLLSCFKPCMSMDGLYLEEETKSKFYLYLVEN
jgi:hypothetical protein